MTFIRLHFCPSVGPRRVHRIVGVFSTGCFSLKIWKTKESRWWEGKSLHFLTPSHFPCMTEANIDWHFTFTLFWHPAGAGNRQKNKKDKSGQPGDSQTATQPELLSALHIYFITAYWTEAERVLEHKDSPSSLLILHHKLLSNNRRWSWAQMCRWRVRKWLCDTDASLSLSASAVIAGGVIGFLFAIFLILLLVYRMRKKDEGSYDLGERKPTGAAYQKAPTKEFYA